MRIKNRLCTLLLTGIILISATACSNENPSSSDNTTTTTTATTEIKNEVVEINTDREGNPITLPETIEMIISMGPSNTEILTALGFGNKIIATDEYSENIAGIKSDIPKLSMISPDGEQMVNLQPDVIFITGMSKAGGEDPLKAIVDAGICVIYIPTSNSIEDIKEDIRFISEVMGTQEKGDTIIKDMENEINAIKKIGESITDKKTVYFEIEAAPYMYSFGKGVFLNEMIELIGARNVLDNQEWWVSIADEFILELNPDVILTCVNYIDNPIDEIKSRPSWNELTAVQNDDVYYIDSDSSNRPSHFIVKALKEMAEAVYPDNY